MTFKTTDRTISRILPGDNFDGFNENKHTRLHAIDTYGLPTFGLCISTNEAKVFLQANRYRW